MCYNININDTWNDIVSISYENISTFLDDSINGLCVKELVSLRKNVKKNLHSWLKEIFRAVML
jgi:hypothetical protein